MELFHDQEFWFAIAFLVFVISMWKPAKKALTGTLDARAEKLRAELDEAARLRAEAQALLDSYRAKQEAAVKSAADILAAAKEEAARMRAHGEEELRRSLAAREAQAMDRIAFAEQEAIQSVKARAVELAVRASITLVGESLDKTAANALIDRAIDDLPAKVA